MGSKGSQQKTEQTSTATSAPNAQAGALYGDILNQLQGYVQQNPNAPVYQGERVAQFTPDQLAAMGTVNQAQGAYQPYMQQAGQFAQQAGSAITPGQINAAMNPYQQQVIDATMAQMGQKNAQQMSSLKGTEAQQGAFGGSRAAVTEANLGGQQNMNMASTLAGLNNQNYTQAVAQAQANRAAAGTGAQLESGLGTQSMQLPFMGAQAQLQTGAQQQKLAQQNLDVPYQNFLQQQAWTPQMLQFQAGLGTGVGSQMGGTSTNAGTTTTTPAQPNPWMQAAGLGLAAGAMFIPGGAAFAPAIAGAALKSASGGRINKADGGSVGSDIVGNAVRMARQMREGMAGGGVPGAGVGTGEYMGHSIPAIIPSMQITGGKGAPSTPGFVASPEMKDPNAGLMKGLGSGLGTLAKAGYDKWNEPMDIMPPAQGPFTPTPVGEVMPSTGVDLGFSPNGLFGSSGRIYSLGGTVSPESAYHGFAHRASGGDVVFDPTPISEQGGEDPNKAPVMPPEGFTDQPPSIVPAGEFKPYEAPPQADVPMPRPRPESLRVDDLAAAPMPIGAAAEAPVPMPRPRPAQTAAAPTGDIFSRLLRTESTGRQLDENGNPLTSPKGAIGIAQIMPTTGPEAAKLARLPWDEQRFKYDANYNATLGKAYFDHQTKVFGGDPEKGAAAYNAGPGRLREAMAMAAAHGGSYKDYLPAETQSYLGKLFGQKQAGLGEPTNGGPQAFSGDTRQDILAKYAKTPIEVRGEPEQGGLELPFSQGDGGDHTRPAIDAAAQAIVPKNDDPRKLPQNLSILERVLGKEFDPATRQAIMAAGLRMMTTPGNIGTVLGTAGMQGMATYSEAKQLEQAQIEAQRKQAFEREKFERQYRELTAQQKAAQEEKQTEFKDIEVPGIGKMTVKIVNNQPFTLDGKPLDLQRIQMTGGSFAENRERQAQAASSGIPLPMTDYVSTLPLKDQSKTRTKIYQDQTKILDKEEPAIATSKSDVQRADRFLELNTILSGPLLGRAPAITPESAEMDSISAELSRKMRQPGEGATSDFDAKQFISATVSRTKPNEANENIAAAFKAAKQNQMDFHNFKRQYLEQNQTLEGSRDYWRAYLEANPIFDKKFPIGNDGNTSNLRLNNNWKNYNEWFRDRMEAKDPIVGPNATWKKEQATAVAPAAAGQGAAKPAGNPLDAARAAIAKGADRSAVIQRLREMGVDPKGL